MSTIEQIHKRFKSDIEKIAKRKGLSPESITKAQFFQYTKLSEWEIRKVGGYNALKNLYYPKPENVVLDQASKLINSHRRKLDREYGRYVAITEEFLSRMEDILANAKWKLTAPRKSHATRCNTDRTLTVMVSDTHFGVNISAKEVGGVNEYNWFIAARRLAFLAEQVRTYKPHARKRTELVIQINGDILAGVIHDQEWVVDLLTVQFSGALKLLLQFITLLAYEFKSVRVYCAPGNHGRAMHKSSKQRATVTKWDSYETMLFLAIKEALRSWKNISVHVPEAPYVIYESQYNVFFQTHGDTVINVGNVGNSLNMKDIDNQINKVNAVRSKKVDVVTVGHVHVPTMQVLHSGCTLLINGCLSGLDPFANSIGVFSNHPAQIIFETVRGHPVGDLRVVHVKEGDKDPSLEKFIEPPTLELE